MTIKAVVWGENVHEQTNKIVAGLYPDGMHGAIAAALNAAGGIEATTATLQEPEHKPADFSISAKNVASSFLAASKSFMSVVEWEFRRAD